MGLFNEIKMAVKAVQSRTVNTQNPGAFFEWMVGSKGSWGRKQLIEQYGKNGYVYASISAISEKVGNIDLTAEKFAARSGKWVPVATHPILTLLASPNQLQSQFDLFEMSQVYLESTGEFFWALEREDEQIVGVELVRPDLVEVVLNEKTNRITGYTVELSNTEKQPYDIDEMVHIKMPNPENPYRGLGTVQAAQSYIETDNSSTDYTRNFFNNNAQPAGIVNFQGTISEPEFKEIKRKWQERYGGTENAGKLAFIKGLVPGFTKLGLGLDEINMQALKEMTRSDIMTMFRVSKPILGIFDDVNLASAKTAHYVFMKEVIDPKMARIVDGLNKQLMPLIDDSGLFRLSYKSPVPQDDEALSNKLNLLTDKVITRNEARAELGLAAIDGGDILYVPISSVPISDNVQEPAPTDAPPPPAEEKKALFIRRKTTTRKKKVA